LTSAADHAGRERSKARSAMAEAITQIQKALELLGSLPDTDDRQSKEFELQLALGGALLRQKAMGPSRLGLTTLGRVMWPSFGC
jgi:hypothetical protein